MAKVVVFGATGVTGWGLCRVLLEYPSKDTFDSAAGLSPKGTSKENGFFIDDDDKQLTIHPGIDLMADETEVCQQLSQVVTFVNATHVYYVGAKSQSIDA